MTYHSLFYFAILTCINELLCAAPTSRKISKSISCVWIIFSWSVGPFAGVSHACLACALETADLGLVVQWWENLKSTGGLWNVSQLLLSVMFLQMFRADKQWRRPSNLNTSSQERKCVGGGGRFGRPSSLGGHVVTTASLAQNKQASRGH